MHCTHAHHARTHSLSVADLRGARASPYAPKWSQFHAVFWKISQNRMLAPPSPRGLTPPPTGNPGFRLWLWKTFDRVNNTRMHSSRMRTTRGSSHPRGGLHQAPPRAGTHPWTRHPRGTRHPAGSRHPLWDQAAPPEQAPPGADPPPPLWTEFLTHPCPKLRLRAVINSLLGKKADKNFTSIRKGFRLHACLSHTKQPTFRKRKSM